MSFPSASRQKIFLGWLRIFAASGRTAARPRASGPALVPLTREVFAPVRVARGAGGARQKNAEKGVLYLALAEEPIARRLEVLGQTRRRRQPRPEGAAPGGDGLGERVVVETGTETVSERVPRGGPVGGQATVGPGQVLTAILPESLSPRGRLWLGPTGTLR